MARLSEHKMDADAIWDRYLDLLVRYDRSDALLEKTTASVRTLIREAEENLAPREFVLRDEWLCTFHILLARCLRRQNAIEDASGQYLQALKLDSLNFHYVVEAVEFLVWAGKPSAAAEIINSIDVETIESEGTALARRLLTCIRNTPGLADQVSSRVVLDCESVTNQE